ncbi:TorD/DmsD family molecular chaperone [Paenibacillus sp. SGZ-1009]|uniref:TorD/DmsD family molecular chaperone n=1 Tax=Paenibacillus campi TaxID=3106031 RepID=UPI002AFE60F9|nr:molecular chaperone TorD family protein [Paenibacillus sp. SGZ-1009]
MTVNTEVKTSIDWLYSRVMTYRLLSEMLQRKPTLSKLIEWRRDAGRIQQLSVRSYSLLSELERTSLAAIVQSAAQHNAAYERLLDEQNGEDHLRAAHYVCGEQEPCGYEAILNSVYAHAGITFKKMDHESDDHIAIELEFMSLLAERLAESEQRPLEQAAVIQAQLDFIEHYLLIWTDKLCAWLTETAPGSLYEQWAAMVQAYLQHDRADLRHYAGQIRRHA